MKKILPITTVFGDLLLLKGTIFREAGTFHIVCRAKKSPPLRQIEFSGPFYYLTFYSQRKLVVPMGRNAQRDDGAMAFSTFSIVCEKSLQTLYSSLFY